MLKSEMQDEIDRLTEQLAEERKALADFKIEVREKAADLADEHGWCGVVDEALRDLGIPPRTEEVTAIIQVEIQVAATTTNTERFNEDREDFLRDSIQEIAVDLGSWSASVTLDEDWGGYTTVSLVDITATTD